MMPRFSQGLDKNLLLLSDGECSMIVGWEPEIRNGPVGRRCWIACPAIWEEKKVHLYMRGRPRLPPCHLGPAWLIPSATSAPLNLYEPANRNQNMAYSGQKEGPRLYRTTLM
jgi:hypothetical protein